MALRTGAGELVGGHSPQHFPSRAILIFFFTTLNLLLQTDFYYFGPPDKNSQAAGKPQAVRGPDKKKPHLHSADYFKLHMLPYFLFIVSHGIQVICDPSIYLPHIIIILYYMYQNYTQPDGWFH